MSATEKIVISIVSLICTIAIVSIVGWKAERPTLSFVAKCEANRGVAVRGYHDWVCVDVGSVKMVDNDRKD